MPHVGPVLEGRTFFCPHCGALYSVSHSRRADGDDNTAKCVVCLKIMTRREEGSEVPTFKLIHRPDDD
jgi:transcription elongation factor Elf1